MTITMSAHTASAARPGTTPIDTRTTSPVLDVVIPVYNEEADWNRAFADYTRT